MNAEPQTQATDTAPGVPAAPRGAAGAQDFARWHAGPVHAELDQWGVVEVHGQDAAAFLHAQVTCDIQSLAPGRWQLGGYCNAKGRLIAIFRAGRLAQDAIALFLPRELAPELAQQLRRFVLRAKVSVRDASAEWIAWGLAGTGCTSALAGAGHAIPAAPSESTTRADGTHLVRLPAGARALERFVLLRARGSAADAAPDHASTAVDAGVWWWCQVDAAVPCVFAATRERFVPQSLNLDVLGGVNFRKGCYPGQEVVARSQYLGKLRRRMFLLRAGGAFEGEDIWVGGQDQAVGRVILAAAAPEGGWDLLAEFPGELAEGPGELRAGHAQGTRLTVAELPYAMVDPTK